MSIERSDIYIKSESGGEVFEELAKLLSKTSSDAATQELLSAINNKRMETVNDIVARYKKETGLDIVLSEDDSVVKTASVIQKFVSKRHKIAQHPILSDVDACKDIESFCQCSGGHKSIHAIIHALREKLGREDISYTDPALVKFIEDCQAKHKETCPNHEKSFEVGQIGTVNEDNHEDQTADYFRGAK